MNKSSTLKRKAGVAVVFGMATATWLIAQSQNYGSGQQSGSQQSGSQSGQQPGQQQGQYQQQQGQYRSGMSGTNQITEINKASELIGMEVKNQQGEKLGEIKDIVIDFQQDRVGYVVLSTDTGTFSAEKLHAVPLRAFQQGSDGKTVTLNATKSTLANSEGFSKESWPSPSNPSWGAQPFWRESGSEYRNLTNSPYQRGATNPITPGKQQQQR
jgi:sporulation protein YlmC with PRC-barrel domain